MFLTDCQTCGRRELRGARSIEMIANTSGGAVLVYRCTSCSATNALQPAGRPAQRELVSAA